MKRLRNLLLIGIMAMMQILLISEVHAATLETPVLEEVTNIEGGQTLTWKKVRGAEKYYVYRKATGEKKWKKIGTTTNTNLNSKQLIANTTYSYTVVALKGSQKSSYNKKGVSLNYIAAPVLSSVSNVSGGQSISWKKTAGADKYYVYRKIPGEKSWTRFGTTTKTTIKSTNLRSGTTYIYTVVALKGTVRSGYYKSGKSLKYLETPTVGTVTNVSRGQMISWKKVTGADKYCIYRKETGEKNWKKFGTTANTSIKSESLVLGKTYVYTVVAVNGSAKSSYDKNGKSLKYAVKMYTIENTDSQATIEADVTLDGTGSGHHAKLVICTPTSAVSFGIQYDVAGAPPYTNKTVAIVENVKSNAPGQQEYIRPGNKILSKGKSYHMMLTVQRDGTGSVYLDKQKIGSFYNPGLKDQLLYLRVEGSGRLNGDSVTATFKNIRCKVDGNYNAGRIWGTYDFTTNSTITSKANAYNNVVIKGKISGLPNGGDWDSCYEKVSGIIQFVM